MGPDDNKQRVVTGSGRSLASRLSYPRSLAVLAIVIIVAIVLTAHHGSKKPVVYNATTPKLATVKITPSGFSPATITIDKGTVVAWVSNNISPVIIAANPYPADNSIPGLSKSSQLGAGGQFRHQFNQTGTYYYHDDLHPNVNGTVIVK